MRSCDGCAACCHALHIEDLNKPTFEDCKHQCAAGCGNYDQRPGPCRDYQCLWLQGHLAQADRPDRLGVIFTMTMHPTRGKLPMLIEVRAGALQQAKVQKAIAQLTANRPVVLSSATGRSVVDGSGQLESAPVQRYPVSLTVRGQGMAQAG